MKTKSQRYSDLVFERVQNRVQNSAGDPDGKKLKKYKGLCKRSGGLLRTMGLIQFLVYLQAKGQRPAEVQHHDLLDDLRKTLSGLKVTTATNESAWIQSVREMDVPAYMSCTRDVLQLLYWHKQIADVLIDGNADFHGEED